MSHLHIPDGILSPFVWLPAWLLTLLIIFLVIKKNGQENLSGKIPFTAISAAIMLLAMSIPLGFLPIHLSLASLAGILLGPAMGFMAVFSVNLILALAGHGGISIVGLNSLIIGSELFISSFLYRKVFNNFQVFSRTFISVSIALLGSVSLMLLILVRNMSADDHLPFHLEAGQWGLLFIIIISGIIIEALASAFIVRYFEKTRPDLISK